MLLLSLFFIFFKSISRNFLRKSLASRQNTYIPREFSVYLGIDLARGE